MKTIQITEEQIDRAKKLYPFKELKGSITNGESNIYGALGEIIIHDIHKENGFDVDYASTYDYDMIIDGYKIDVKTKKTKVNPLPHYLCSISAFNTKQNCDIYFFVRINENLKECYLLGYKEKNQFFHEAIFNKKGSFDINGFPFKDDCYNLKIEQLNEFNFKLTNAD
jgi:penicillin-binding protein-related factor A (putative recombinase)